MCGIAGVVAWDEKYRVKRDQLQRMADALAHRGPDGEGFYLNHEQEITPDNPQCGFAFRRLAIIDPDPRSNQPFTIGHQALVFNGEIYNYRELRAELSRLRPDYGWRTQGDTEVLLMSYAVWGEKCLEHLNGMFAFAVWDDAKKELFLARDRMGQKPLYVDYHVERGGDGLRSLLIAFASELPALRPVVERRDEVVKYSLESYLRYGYVHGSIYGGAYQIRPASWWKLDKGWRRTEIYFDPNDDRIVATGDLVLEAKTRVLRAVERQLVSDVPLGVFLSGGVDSAVIATCARRFGRVATYSISFDHSLYDESHFAQQVAERLGTDHHQFRVTPSVAEDLPKLVAIFGEPFADSSSIPTHYLARETRKSAKVALSGDGGDELFGGYDRYRAMRLGARVKPKLARMLLASAASPLTGRHPKSRLGRATRFAASLRLDDPRRYDSYVRIFDDATIRSLLKERIEVSGLGDYHVHDDVQRELEKGRDPAAAAMAADRVHYLPKDLLTKVDRCSMLHGLEVRSPFMDHELVQFAAGLTTDQLLKGGPKRMLREAFAKDLPDFVFKRPKMGFAVPIGEWFRGELRPMLRDNLFAADSFGRQHFNMKVVERLVEEHESQRVDHSQRLYALLMLELWWQWHRSTATTDGSR